MPFGITWRNIAKTNGGVAASDSFNRVNGAMGSTETGGLPWQVITGTWSISSNRAYTSTGSSSNPIAVVDSGGSDVDISLNISSGGGDALYFRVVDATNWWRIRHMYYSQQDPYSCPSYCTSYQYMGTYGGSAPGYPLNQTQCNTNTAHAHSGSSSIGGASPTEYAYCASMSCCVSSSHYHSHGVVPPPECNTMWVEWHYHGRTACSYTGSTSSYQCGTTTCYTTNYYYITYLERSVNGTVTQQKSVSGVAATTLRALAVGNSIRWFVNGTERSAHTDSAHLSATKHGVGRGYSQFDGHTIDNFSLTPKD